jgi:hypothetical protein
LKGKPKTWTLASDILLRVEANESKVTIWPFHIWHFDIPRFPEELFAIVGEDLTFALLVIFTTLVGVAFYLLIGKSGSTPSSSSALPPVWCFHTTKFHSSWSTDPSNFHDGEEPTENSVGRLQSLLVFNCELSIIFI